MGFPGDLEKSHPWNFLSGKAKTFRFVLSFQTHTCLKASGIFLLRAGTLNFSKGPFGIPELRVAACLAPPRPL